jgi:hypothetical protein
MSVATSTSASPPHCATRCPGDRLMVRPGGPGSDRAGWGCPGRQPVETELRQIGWPTAELDPLRRPLGVLLLRQPGCAALRVTQFDIGAAVAICARLGDVHRFASSDEAVRHTGHHRVLLRYQALRPASVSPGPPLLRWGAV